MTIFKGPILILGRFRDGAPDGWCWIFSPDNKDSSSEVLYVKFNHGLLQRSKAVLVDIDNAIGWIGSYNDGFLDNAKKIKIEEYADVKCVRQIKIPDIEKIHKTPKSVPLPVKIKFTGGRLSIVSTRLLMFNRIAKVSIFQSLMNRDIVERKFTELF